jgi:hypothetical protein
MNFFLNYERKLILAALCLVSAFGNAQLRFPFTNLSLEELNSKYFFPQSFNTIRVPNPYSDTTSLTPAQCATLFMSMGRASLDSTHVLSDFSGFREHKDSVAHSEGCYSIALLDLEYADFHHDAIDSNWVQRVDGHFYRTEGCSHSPYCIKEAWVLWVDAPHITQRTYRFLFSSSSFISSYEEDLISLEINFDDGMGWRILQPNALYDVDYSTEGRNRNIRCRIQREGKPMKYAACNLKNEEEYNPCAHSSFPYPNLPPWNNEGASPWNLSLEVEGESVACRAYTLTSEDGIFDKPFLFVEGIDFGLDRDGHPIHDTYRHGTFGWCEFTSGFQDPVVSDDIEYGYDDLHKMLELLNAIRAEGYDLVLVDFYDGATWLQHNSELVQQVIRLCNEYKDGNEPLVVAGASMGGVISRHALRTMELNGEDHCARLWISLDAPHEGAHIPLALQHAIRFNAEHGEQQAQLFRDRYLSRPAAKQLLDAQVFNSLIDFESWYGPLREMGYPQTCRRIAISNGRGNGEGLNYQHDELMDWQCSIGALEHTKMLMLPESGDDENPNALPNMPVLGHFKKLLTGMENMGDEIYFWLGGANLALLDAADIAEQVVYTAEGVVNRDYAPGGKRNTIQTFASSINAALDALSDMESAIANCESVSPEDYNRDHAFVLTGSSVGLQLQDSYTDVEQYLWEHPDENYFDRVWFASDHNENHTELTDENVEVVLEEVLAQDLLALDSVLTAANSNNGVFNFGRPEFSYLRSIHVHSGGEIRINQFANTHFSQSNDYVSLVNHFEVRTMPCSPELIRIGNGGLLEIGDANTEYRTGALCVGRDSKLQIAAGGRLRINEGSSLVIEEGAILEVLPGGVIEVVSGRIEVMAGGECRFRGSNNQYVQHEIVGCSKADNCTWMQTHACR